MSNSLDVEVFPFGSHELAEYNSNFEPMSDFNKLGKGWTEEDLIEVIQGCRYLYQMAPPDLVAEFPPPHVYPGSNYIAIGDDGPYSYWAIRGSSGKWIVTMASDRDAEAGRGDIVFSAVGDALKWIFYNWMVLAIFSERGRYRGIDMEDLLWKGRMCKKEVVARKFEWSRDKEMFSGSYQKYLLNQLAAHQRRVGRLSEGDDPIGFPMSDRIVYCSIHDESKWFISHELYIPSLDLTWGLGVSISEFLDRLAVQIDRELA